MTEPLKPDFGAAIGKPRGPKRKVASPAEEATDAQLTAAAVVDSTRLAGKTEEISELVIRRMANVVLLGDEAFMPKTLAEASSVAKTWSQIASLAKARANGRGLTGLEDEDATSRVAKRLLTDLNAMKKTRTDAG